MSLRLAPGAVALVAFARAALANPDVGGAPITGTGAIRGIDRAGVPK